MCITIDSDGIKRTIYFDEKVVYKYPNPNSEEIKEIREVDEKNLKEYYNFALIDNCEENSIKKFFKSLLGM